MSNPHPTQILHPDGSGKVIGEVPAGEGLTDVRIGKAPQSRDQFEQQIVDTVFWSCARMAAMELFDADSPDHREVESCRALLAEAMRERQETADAVIAGARRMIETAQRTPTPEDERWFGEFSKYLANVVKRHTFLPSAAARDKVRRAVAMARGARA